ncbi:MAG TPA: outer membrane lipoprotein carrier protein LolA [Bacteroidia bacterium]|nr:outer membrane lipoprotein carrier protein LolA [Bacteroidia bacterium]
MKIKHLTILFLSVFFVSTQVNAQDNVKKAKQILNKLSKTYKGYKNIKAAFTIATENVDKSTSSLSGTIWIKDEDFKITMDGQEIVCDGDTIWTAQVDLKEVTVKDYKPSANEIQPAQIFSIWDKGFDYTWVESVTEKGVAYDIIDLIPKENKEAKDYSKVKLKVNTKTNSLVSATIIKKNGVKITYSITSQETNLTLDKKFFWMDTAAKKKAGYLITDLRKKKKDKK